MNNMTNNTKIIIISMISILFFACPKKVKKVEITPPPTVTQPSNETELDIRGDEFVSISDLQVINFDFDSFSLTEAAKSILEQNAKYLLAHPELEILVEGHCCECGTNEYNLGLGQRRASVVRDYYISLGISGSSIATISYGEEKLINKNVAPPDTPKCIPNRRAETKVRTKKK